jgi:hypothetical protein
MLLPFAFILKQISRRCILSFGLLPGVWILYADVSEHSVPSSYVVLTYEDVKDGVFRNVGT